MMLYKFCFCPLIAHNTFIPGTWTAPLRTWHGLLSSFLFLPIQILSSFFFQHPSKVSLLFLATFLTITWHCGKHKTFEVKQTWLSILLPPFTSCVTLSNYLSSLNLGFCIWQMAAIMPFKGLQNLNIISYRKCQAGSRPLLMAAIIISWICFASELQWVLCARY